MPHPSTSAADKQDALPPEGSLDSSITCVPDCTACGLPRPGNTGMVPAPHAHAFTGSMVTPISATATSSAPQPMPLGPVVGLVNLGNTCYLNAAMQLLLACQPLVQELQQQQQQQEQGGALGTEAGPLGSLLQQQQQTMAACHFGKGPLGSALQQALLHASAGRGARGHGAIYNPQALLAAVRKNAPALKGRQQQDSHEVLHLVLEGLEAEERLSRQACAQKLQQQLQEQDKGMALRGGRVLSSSLAQANGGPGAEVLAARLQQWVAAPTLVERVFGGRLASAIVCCSCGFESVSSEPFLDLSLPLPQQWHAQPDQQQQQQQHSSGAAGKGSSGGAAADTGDVAACRQRPQGEEGEGAATADCSGAPLAAAATSSGSDCRRAEPASLNAPVDQARARHKRKSVDEPCLVPFVSPIASKPPPPAAMTVASMLPAYGWAGHAAGQRVCPSITGLAQGLGAVRPAARSSSSDLHAAPPGAPSGRTPSPEPGMDRATAIAAVCNPNCLSEQLGSGIAVGDLAVQSSHGMEAAGLNASAGVGAVAGSSSSSNCSSRHLGGDGQAPPGVGEEFAPGSPPAGTPGGAVTRAKARRIKGPGCLSEQLASGAVVASLPLLSCRQPQSSNQLQGLQAGTGAPAAMDLDNAAAGVTLGAAACRGASGNGPAELHRIEEGCRVQVKQEPRSAGQVVPDHSEGSSQGLPGRLWVGTPEDRPVQDAPSSVPSLEPEACGASRQFAGRWAALKSSRPHLRLCLAEFFQQEAIHWDCPRDKAPAPQGLAGPQGTPQLCRSAPAAPAPVAMQQRQQRRGAGPAEGDVPGRGPPADFGASRLPPRSRASSRIRGTVEAAQPSAQQQQQRRARRQRSSGTGDPSIGLGAEQGVFQMEDVGADVAVSRAAAPPAPARRCTRRSSAGPTAGVIAQAPSKAEQLRDEGPVQQASNVRQLRALPQRLAWAAAAAAPVDVPNAAANAAGARCYCAHRALKSYRLHAVPPVLLVHLKRFRRDEGGIMRKVGVHVGFDMAVEVPLDPSIQQVHGAAPAHGAPQHVHRSDIDVAVLDGGASVQAGSHGPGAGGLEAARQRYRLVGLVEHVGSMKSGHYVAYVCRPREQAEGQQLGLKAHAQAMNSGGMHDGVEAPDQQWFCVSDTSVRAVSEQQVLAAQAYVLMYVRCA